ncbi:MAG: lytic transglycosylase domain-containing protein [Alphaproteobacteria bacterium]|nr:lytic transglycosylase domain-containing protein [Alphaproteobacteria bacterium]
MTTLRPARRGCGPIAAVMLFVSCLFAAPPDLQSAPLSPQDLKEYEIAFRAVDRGRWDIALKHAERPTDRLPAKAIRWLYLQSDASDASFEEIVEFIAENPGWPRQERLELRAEQAMSDALPDTVILSWFRDHPPKTGKGFLLYAAALKRAGLHAQLSAEAIRAWRELDMSASDEHAFRSEYRKLIPMDDEIYRLDRLIWEQNYAAAERQAHRVPDAYRQLADARIRLARRAGGVDAAINRVPPTLQDHPGLIFERLRWRRLKGRQEDAIELMAWPDMQKAYPERWWHERAVIARDLLEDGQPQRAYDIASQHRVPDGADFAEAEWFAGWVALRHLNDPEKAFPHFRDMYGNVGYPVSRSRAAYWAGRAAEAAGKAEIAQQWYAVAAHHTSSFYGQLAAMKLPIDLRPTLPNEPFITPVERDTFESTELAQVIRHLSQIGADETVRALVWHLARTYRDPSHFRLLADLSTDIGRLDLAVFTARQAIKSEVVTLGGYPELPLTDSRIADLTIVHGLIRQESGFDIGAISRAGAMGLMQLMPATARSVSGWEKIKYRQADLTTDINYNVRLGSAYLKDLLEKFDGVLPMALAGYNAGPHRVTTWIRRFGDPRDMSFEDTIDWMESIPFSETRNYVQRVIENINVYRQRATGRSMPITFRAEIG